MPILDELLLPHPEVAIVLATIWVRMRSFEFAKKQLSPLLQERVIGATYHRRFMRDTNFERLPRGVQIANDVERRKPRSWMAIDDAVEGWPDWCRDNLIATNPVTGIGDLAIQLAMRKTLDRSRLERLVTSRVFYASRFMQ
jgi:hypothetical protein